LIEIIDRNYRFDFLVFAILGGKVTSRIMGAKFTFYILIHLIVAAERASLHKVKPEEITKICLFSPEIQVVEIFHLCYF